MGMLGSYVRREDYEFQRTLRRDNVPLEKSPPAYWARQYHYAVLIGAMLAIGATLTALTIWGV